MASLDDRVGELFSSVYQKLPPEVQEKYNAAHPQEGMPPEDDVAAQEKYKAGVVRDLEKLGRKHGLIEGGKKTPYMVAAAGIAALVIGAGYFL